MRQNIFVLGTILMLTLSAPAQDTPLNRKITVDFKNQPVPEALKDVEKLVGMRITFVEEALAKTDPVSFQARDQEAGRVLTRILRPRGLQLSLKGNRVDVSRRGPADISPLKREDDFGFVQKPTVTRQGDHVTLRFETRSFCDVTVAVEDAEGKIIRHMACGVLGENAPDPFVWNSKKQVVPWDGKDDKGVYVDDKASCSIRVSLGLKARYERNLMWSPKKRGPTAGTSLGSNPPIVTPAPEGVYVYDGESVGEHVRLFDHEGDYVRTIYPFPREKLSQVKGLQMMPGGPSRPLRWHQQLVTMLTSADSHYGGTWPVHLGGHGYGISPSALAVRGNRLILAAWRLNRLATDGSSGGMDLTGPGVTYRAKLRALHEFRGGTFDIPPRSAAIDPKGEWLYLTGYAWNQAWNQDGLHGVVRVRVNGNEAPTIFAGDMTQGKAGKDDALLCFPLGVTCDAEARVYVCDYMNDRIQIFSPAGTLLKTFDTFKPVQLEMDPRTGELFVFSWLVGNDHLIGEYTALERRHETMKLIRSTLTRYGPIDWKQTEKEARPKTITSYPLSLDGIPSKVKPYMGVQRTGLQCRVAIDFWAKEPVVWISEGTRNGVTWDGNVRLYSLKGKKLALVRDFGKDVTKEDPQPRSPYHGRQRLYFDHRNEKLYVGEQFPDPLHIKSFWQVIQIDPNTGKDRIKALPFDCEDMAFDMDGNAYLRTLTQIVRYDARTWRELPFDYGEEKKNVTYSQARSGRAAGSVNSAIECRMEGNSSSQFYGMWVSPRDYIVITGCHRTAAASRKQEQNTTSPGIKTFEPQIYAGRPWGSFVHIFNKHGKPVYEDALPGSDYFQGITMDKNDNLYIQHSGMPPGPDGKYPSGVHQGACTLIKLKAESRFLTPGNGIVPLPAASQPKRPPDFLSQGTHGVWINQADWMYGGVGLSTKGSPGGNCHCFGNSRFGFDYFDRSFVSELQHYRLTVLDGNGNLVLQIGRYGNADDGKPLVSAKASPAARSIGGDEVALMQPLFLAAQTDKRIFVADIGNYRIFSVKLDYHTEERVPLKDVPDMAK